MAVRRSISAQVEVQQSLCSVAQCAQVQQNVYYVGTDLLPRTVVSGLSKIPGVQTFLDCTDFAALHRLVCTAYV